MPLATTTAAAAGRYVSPPGVPNAAGWGALDEDGTLLTPQLQQAYLQVQTPADCNSLISGFDTGTQTCAGTPGAGVACVGDSGGPLVQTDGSTGQPALWGVTSYGPQATAGLAPCSVDLPAVYTWIPAYARFIESTIASQSDASDSVPAPAGAPTARCRKAQAVVTAARRRERTALRQLREARRHRIGPAARRRTRLDRRRYRAARARRRRAAATAERRCRV
jgi:secreted trypsin-like serine protease